MPRKRGSRPTIQPKQTEDPLRESEARFRTVVRAMNAVVRDWNLKTNALWWSDNVCGLFGYRPEELEPDAEAWSSRLHPDEKDRIVSDVQAAIQSRQPFWSGEYRFRRADGSYADVYDRGYIQFDESGAPERMTGALMDITARKTVETSLKKSQQILEQAQQVARLGIWHWDIPTNTVTWSDQLYRFHGIKPGEFSATYEGFLSLVHPEDREAVRTTIESTYRSGQPYEIEFRVFRPDGTMWWNHSRGELIRDADGAPVAMIGVAQDITERRRVEEELLQREEQLWQLLVERDRLSQNLHDNIIQRIYAIGLGMEECQQLSKEDSATCVERLGRAIAELNAVIRDVRSYIKRTEPGLAAAARLRTELAKLVDLPKGTRGPHITLRIDPDALSRMSPVEASEVLSIAREAISNCVRHSGAKAGSVLLTLRDGAVRFEVVDDGVGLHIGARATGGHGLRNIAARAEALGGQLELASAPAGGTRITVTIPKESAGEKGRG